MWVGGRKNDWYKLEVASDSYARHGEEMEDYCDNFLKVRYQTQINELLNR